MKKAEYKELALMGRKGSVKNGHGRSINGMAWPAGSKLSRKAAENAVGSRRVGVVSNAYEQMAKDKRRA